MEKIIVGDITPYETRIAILEDKVLNQLFYQRYLDQRIVGNIYMGKVTNVLPGMESAFVDIGIGKDVFLQAGDIDLNLEEGERPPETIRIQKYLQVGNMIPTQIIKDSLGNKGARASTNITLPGRFCVLVPSMKGNVAISRKINNERERQRLGRIAREVLPTGLGLIMRTISESQTEFDLKSDITYLVETHKKIQEKISSGQGRGLIHGEPALSMKIVRDYFTDDVQKFVLNSKSEYEKILNDCEFLTPFQRASLEFYDGKAPIFEKFGIDLEIDGCLNPKVWLKSGGYLIIEPTEALVSIDVNSGKFTGKNNLATTVYQTNLSAIKEIARQIRLRNLAGIIIIDFIDMQNESHKRDVVNKLRLEFEKDPVKTQIFELTDLGLVQMTRHRTGKRLGRILQEECPYCEGQGQVISRETTTCKILTEIGKKIPTEKRKKFVIQIHPTVGAFIRENYEFLLKEIADRYQKEIELSDGPSLHFCEYKIEMR